MLRLIAAFIVSSGLGLMPLASCGTTPAQQVGSVVGASPEQVQQVLNTAKKGMTAAHNAHRFAADLATALAKAGVLKGANATKTEDLLKQSYAVLQGGDQAIAVGDAKSATDAIDKANGLIDQIHTIIGS